MDEMNKNNSGRGQNSEENGNPEEVKIWKSPDKGRRKKYVYEVITEGEQTGGETSGEASGRKTADPYSVSGSRSYYVKHPEGTEQTVGEASRKTGMEGSKDPDRESRIRTKGKPQAGRTGGRASDREEIKRQKAQLRRLHAEQKEKEKKLRRQQKRKEQKEKQERNLHASQSRREENLRDNMSKGARQKVWRGRMVEGSYGRLSPFGKLVKGIGKHWKRIGATVLILALVLGGAGYYNRVRQFHRYDVLWQISAAENEYSRYLSFNDVILHYSQDGVSCIDQNGEVIWNQAFNMDVPRAAVRGDYAVIYDENGTSIYICNKDGCTGTVSVEKKILRADISAGGVTAVVLDDKNSNYIDYYKKDGTQLKVEIKTMISGDGYPMDLAISPDGMQLITSYLTMESSKKTISQVVFRNFEVGKNNADRVVGGFKHEAGILIPEVLFFDDQHSAALTENSIEFYSTKNALEPKQSDVVTVDSKIKTAFHNDAYVGVILEQETAQKTGESQTGADSQKAGDNSDQARKAADEGVAKSDAVNEQTSSYRMLVYDKNGRKVIDRDIDFEYETAEFSGDGILIYNKTELAVYNMTGVCKYQGKPDITISGAARFSENSLIIYGNGALQKLTLK